MNEQLKDKIRKHGLNDLRLLAPIGNLGFANGWAEEGSIESAIVKAAREQGYKFKEISRYRSGSDTEFICKELGLVYHVDMS